MTDKQIIIDGVDVSGCKYCLKMTKYRCAIQRDVYKCLCKENPNCYYKQLKRKEEEFRNICKAFDIEYVIDKETGSLIDRCNKLNKKEQECEELKQTLTKIKDIAEKQVPYLNIGEAKTMIEIGYDYAGAICNLEQRMYKILQKISEVNNDR